MPLPDPQTIDNYGGAKVDAFPVVDSETTESAEEHNALTCDTAAMSRMAPRAMVRFVGGSPPTDPPSGMVHESMWGHSLAVKPTVEYDFTGFYRIAWPTEVTNELGETVTLNLRWASVSYEFGGTPSVCVSYRMLGPNQIAVYTYTPAGVVSNAAVTITVVAY